MNNPLSYTTQEKPNDDTVVTRTYETVPIPSYGYPIYQPFSTPSRGIVQPKESPDGAIFPEATNNFPSLRQFPRNGETIEEVPFDGDASCYPSVRISRVNLIRGKAGDPKVIETGKPLEFYESRLMNDGTSVGPRSQRPSINHVQSYPTGMNYITRETITTTHKSI